MTLEFNSKNSGTATLNVYDMLGKKIMSNETQTNTGANMANINTANLGNGIYIMELDNNGQAERMKFMISR